MNSAGKIFAILEALCTSGEMRAMDISRTLDISKGSVHRILNTLRELGYIDPASKPGWYAPSLKIYSLGRQVRQRLDMVDIARPLMQKLLETYNRVVNLGVFIDNDVHIIERLSPSNTPVSIVLNQTLPAYCSALGKLFLAEMSKTEMAAYLKQVSLESYTPHTLTSPAALRKALNGVQGQGFAIDDRELSDHFSCVAAPVRDDQGHIVAAVSLSGLSKVRGKQFKVIQKDLTATAEKISQLLAA